MLAALVNVIDAVTLAKDVDGRETIDFGSASASSSTLTPDPRLCPRRILAQLAIITTSAHALPLAQHHNRFTM